jgi:hypothetical protein
MLNNNNFIRTDAYMRLPLPPNDTTLRPLISFYPLPTCLCPRWMIGREGVLSDMAKRGGLVGLVFFLHGLSWELRQ